MRRFISCVSVLVAVCLVLSAMPAALCADYSAVPDSYSSREWKYANTGSNAGGECTVHPDGSLTIAAQGGKFADSEEGFCFYYTEIDADTENFVLTATFKVKDVSKSDNQTALGLIITDTVGPQNSGRYMNYAACGAYKLSGKNSGYRVPGARFVTGYTSETAESPTENTDGSGTSLRVCDMTNAFVGGDMFTTGTEYTFTIRKSNTGYHCTMKFAEEEYILYGVEQLLVQDREKLYAGFFASRFVTVDVYDISMKVIAPDKDDAKVEAPATAVPLSVLVYSPTSTASTDYSYIVRSTHAGTVTVESPEGRVYVEPTHVEALEYFTKTIKLENESISVLKTKFVPDSELVNPISVQTVVNYRSYGKPGSVLYVSPDVTQDGDGTRKNPLSIYTAVKYALPGQTIVLLDGTYLLTRKLTVERGISGTQDALITMRPESEGGVLLDCTEMNITSGEAFWLAGDFWHIYGLRLINAPGSAKGIRVSGSNNTVEMCSVSGCGNTGIQISGSSQEPFEKWPAGNLVKNCDSSNNCDPAYADADGFAAKLTCGDGNSFYGCVSHHNIDDGFDLYAKSVSGAIGAVVIENCVAYANGFTLASGARTGEGNGFKLGGENLPGGHKLINSVAFGNGAKGITSNSCPDVYVSNCTAYGNAIFGTGESVSLYTNMPSLQTSFVISNVISLAGSSADDRLRVQKQDALENASVYLWNGTESVNSLGEKASGSWFESVDTDIAPTRNSDGTINMQGLLVLNANAPDGIGAVIADGAGDPRAQSRMPELAGSSAGAPWYVWLIIGVAVLAAAAGAVLILFKRKRNA